MSVEDEIELKDLLVQTLTENGSLAKIKVGTCTTQINLIVFYIKAN